jgi:hypothetical protein
MVNGESSAILLFLNFYDNSSSTLSVISFQLSIHPFHPAHFQLSVFNYPLTPFIQHTFSYQFSIIYSPLSSSTLSVISFQLSIHPFHPAHFQLSVFNYLFTPFIQHTFSYQFSIIHSPLSSSTLSVFNYPFITHPPPFFG